MDGRHATNGHATNGHATDGHATDGHAAEGHVTNGHTTDGHAAEGHAKDGHATDGHAAAVQTPTVHAPRRDRRGDAPEPGRGPVLFDRPRTVVAVSMEKVEVRFESDHAAVTSTRASDGARRRSGTVRRVRPACRRRRRADDCADAGSWILVAHSEAGSKFVVLPGCVTDSSSSSPASLSFCLRTVLDLSDGCAAKEVSFYGDSGLNLLYPADGISDPVKGNGRLGAVAVPVRRPITRAAASEHPVVRTGDGYRSPAFATDGEGAPSLYPRPPGEGAAPRPNRAR
ncbi:hypothetical protein THAOC_25758 [Thalassiosira oceanica]|uniref:Uncharacterized protein n=1 Tax=Thalassiosira oceanica TaxID=159749 RepID=K0S6X3_THAOC|nr:hypothetical protein THAOC_25758 [Thalassiosira oceanica]|eukprot:EJK54597.1 hypothetical protein THAOC_25758 [Thalassiosira oceanica]